MTLTTENGTGVLRQETLESVRDRIRRAFEENQAHVHGGEILQDRLRAGEITIADLQGVADSFKDNDRGVRLQFGDHLVIRVPVAGLARHPDSVHTLGDVVHLLDSDVELRSQSVMYPSDNVLFVLNSLPIWEAREEAIRRSRRH